MVVVVDSSQNQGPCTSGAGRLRVPVSNCGSSIGDDVQINIAANGILDVLCHVNLCTLRLPKPLYLYRGGRAKLLILRIQSRIGEEHLGLNNREV